MAQHIVQPRTYIWVFAWLMLLFIATVAFTYLPLHGTEWIVAYAIAAVKSVLVILYFMHIRYSLRLAWIFAAAGFLWLGILLTLTASDYLTRGWTPAAEILNPQAPRLPPPPGFR